ncbi:MAG TPA: aldo/keto reductase, partial [Stellaceae bacterium]|nr:aldo/keto reductase [Stellaceae bacterium]
NRTYVEGLEAIAADKRCAVAQLCLAWLLAQGDDVIPIPGTKNLDRLKENLGAMDITLSPQDLVAIAEVLPAGAAAGTRYPAGGMAGVFI